jgi:hypothetical protein
MRSMASGAAFHRAYPCATQQAFLEAHELAFAYFEGVFRRLARKLGVHRRMVREAVRSAVPAQRKKTERPAAYASYQSTCASTPQS